MKKIPCNESGALILPGTADATGGKCMACKQGIRASLEESRAFYQRLEEYDPFRELWVSLVERSSHDGSLTSWSLQEKYYFSVVLLEGEIYNGGFDQYFSNSSGDYYSLAVVGLKELEAEHSLRTLQEAAETLFGGRGPPVGQAARWNVMYAKSRRLSEFLSNRRRLTQLERLDKLFWEDPDCLGERLTGYAEKYGLVTPFRIAQN